MGRQRAFELKLVFSKSDTARVGILNSDLEKLAMCRFRKLELEITPLAPIFLDGFFKEDTIIIVIPERIFFVIVNFLDMLCICST